MYTLCVVSSMCCVFWPSNMKFHVHIQPVEVLAMHAASDLVVSGTDWLKKNNKTLPRPAYYKSISIFARNDRRIRYPIVLDDVLEASRQRNLYLGDIVCAIDHVVLQAEPWHLVHLEDLFSALVDSAWQDIDAACLCLHRFASRCAALQQHALMVKCMSKALSQSPKIAIRSIVLQYGAVIDHNDPLYVQKIIRNGCTSLVSQAITDGALIRPSYLVDAIYSSELETVTLVTTALGSDVHIDDDNDLLNAHDFTISFCQGLLSLNVLQPQHQYNFYAIGSIAVLQWLLDHNLIDVQYAILSTTSSACTDDVHFDILKHLVEHAKIQVPSDIFSQHVFDGMTMIDLSVVDYLIAHGANVNEIVSSNSLGINGEFAVILEEPLLIRYWLHKKLRVDLDDGTSFSSESSIKIMKKCMLSGAPIAVVVMILETFHININAKDADNWTCLHYAAKYSSLDVIILLVEFGAMLAPGAMTSPSIGMRVMDEIMRTHTDVNVFKMLLGALRIDVNCRVDIIHAANGSLQHVAAKTALHSACRYDHVEAAQVLLQRLATRDFMYRDESPLFIACRVGSVPMVSLLLEYDADVNYGITPDGFRSLHIACTSGNAEIVKLLLDHGASNLLNTVNQGHTVLHMACRDGHADIVQLLIHHSPNVNVNVIDYEGQTPLHLAVLGGHADVVRILLEHSRINVNSLNNENQTPMMVAWQLSDPAIVQLFGMHSDQRDKIW